MKINRDGIGILLVASLLVAPYALIGYGGHDFQQHAPSWMELRDLWQAGQFRAGWAPRANFNLGDPRFCFYPPVSFAIGAGLSLFLPFRLVPTAFVWLAFVVSGLSMYWASKDFLAPEDRIKASWLYMVSPYLTTTAIVRFAAAELWTLTWLPLVFLYFYRSIWLKESRSTILLACTLGLTWITNVPAAIVLLYVLLVVAAIIAVRQRSIRPVISSLLAELLAGALAAFYLAPTWLEQAWIHKDAVLRDSYTHYFISLSFSHLPMRGFFLTLWLFACVAVGLMTLYAWTGRSNLREDTASQTWLTFTFVAFIFQLPVAVLLWKYLPQLRFVDFPYRFSAPVGAMLPLMLLSRATPKTLRLPSYILLALIALLPFREYRLNKAVLVNLSDLVRQWQQHGYRAWPEFVPAGATRPTRPVDFAPASVMETGSGSNCDVALESPKTGERILRTRSTAPCQVRLAMYFYPYWKATDDSGNVLTMAKDSYGLLLINVPAGQHTVRLRFNAKSVARTSSLVVSFVSLLIVGTVLILGRNHSSFRLVGQVNRSVDQVSVVK